MKQTNVFLVIAVAMLIAGCEAGSPPGAEVAVAAAITPSEPIAVAVEPAPNLDEAYLVGYSACRELGFRIDWQVRTPPESGSGIKSVALQEDSVFVLDGRNFLTRVLRDDGTRLWRLPVAGTNDEIYGITYVAHLDRVFLVTGGDLLLLDADTGSLVGKQRLEQVASTAPVVVGPFFVYGARNGQVVWHSYEVGFQWRAYQISPAMRIPPTRVDDKLIAIGSDGRIMALDAESAMGRWDKYLLDEVVAPPASGGGLVYLAGLDQYIWALDLETGRRAWRHLTQSPLTASPVVIGDRLYQQVPDVGLVCFESRPVDAPDGRRLWTASGVGGSVIGRLRDRLLVWDATGRTLTSLEPQRGATVATVVLPAVRHLEASGLQSSDLLAAGDDGRIIRIVPRG